MLCRLGYGPLSQTRFQIAYNARSTAEEVLKGIDLTGKTVLLTGCNSGLGFETLRQMTGQGAHVIVAARNLKTAQDACAKVGGSTTPVACDLGSLSSVKQAIAAIRPAADEWMS